MNRHALSVLQYPDALELVAGYAANPVGAEAVRALEPSDARVWAEDELERVDEMMTFVLRNEDWAVPVVPDLRDPLARLGVEGSVWRGEELRDAGRLLRSARTTRRAILEFSDDYPLLSDVAGRLAKMESEADAIEHAIDDDGGVLDRASKELRRLRVAIRDARSSMVQKLERFIDGLPGKIRVPDASVSIREGRYVVPIRREGRSQVGGIVHDESATGHTLFVEPPVAIEAMNELRELELGERREVRRILAELTDRLRPRREPLETTLDALIELDSLYARGRYALHYNGNRPELLSAGAGSYRVVNGRHPLLLAGAEHVVPFDLHMEPDERTLMVSGPNTGGKTVLLKAMGLISAMAQAGIVPPVGPDTRLPLFRDIFADIGDEQSIEASLSTFSAHLKNLREILEEADEHSLVLIDEIGSGTDPTEGGALARAILVELTRREAMSVATSHLGQLKLLAGEEAGVVNASLQFDSRELRPTYRLVKGVPGRSYGLAIAGRLGFPEKILEGAEAFRPEEEREVGSLLAEMEEKERRLAAELSDAEAARRRANGLRNELEDRVEKLREREKDAERRARQQARDILLQSRQQVEEAIGELRDAVDEGAAEAFEEHARRARRKVEQAAGRQAERMPEKGRRPEEERKQREVSEALAPGARVRVAATGAEGTVVELRDGRATVETGGLRLEMSAAELEVLKTAEETAAEAAKQQRRRAESAAAAGGGWTGPAADASSEVDLRGLRVHEVERKLLPALDAAVQARLPVLRIIHGKGTGAVREAVHELLEQESQVEAFRLGGPGEGGTGVTIVELA